MNWGNILLDWYAENKRPLLWRKTKEPYAIWLSEVILQQTRVEQGMPYYIRFIEKYPTVQSLASAKEEEVLKLWQGLGYYSRARNMLYTAKQIVEEKGGEFPTTFKELIQLKGVGDYTASAISSICFSEYQAVVDGNVYRFFSRFFGIEMEINTSVALREFKRKANELMQGYPPGTFNQAVMEFGSLQCVPKNPKCSQCPFSIDCIAFNQNKIEQFPVKKKKTKVTTRYFNYLVFSSPQKEIILVKREQKGIWHKLYEFPLIESKEELTETRLKKEEDFQKWVEASKCSLEKINSIPVKHLLSHQRLYITFWRVETMNLIGTKILEKELKNYPVPIAIENFINANYDW